MRFLSLIFLVTFGCNTTTQKTDYAGKESKELQKQLARGWNTWNTRSVLSHVLLPEYFAINLKLQNKQSGDILHEALIGRRSEKGEPVEKIIPGDHSYDGSYTDLEIEWQGLRLRIQTALTGNDMVLLATPLQANNNGLLLAETAFLWNKKGRTEQKKNQVAATVDDSIINVFPSNETANAGNTTGFLFNLSDTIGLSTGSQRSLQQIKEIIEAGRNQFNQQKTAYKEEADLYNGMQRVLAWNVIYEPDSQRVIVPVSRLWNSGMWKGWVLFDWDTYFSAMMMGLDNKALAYANAIAITNEITDAGFIPNFAAGLSKSSDRSQPPVGSLAIKTLYKKYQEKWLLYETFDKLLIWNRWWHTNRQQDGYLVWGSDPYTLKEHEPEWLLEEINVMQGAKFESGLDNSPMYDNIPFDTIRHQMMLADVGLMALYISDCDNLAEIAEVLGKTDIVKELNSRKQLYSANLQKLWNKEAGIFLNKRTDNDSISHRLSPTLFYPLLAGVASDEQAQQMIQQHFYNTETFWGEYIMPSIARNDPAYKDQEYWRGRIWAPMNFLVYLGLRKYNLGEAQKDMAEKSKNLFLKSWLTEGAVYENYNANTGQGDDVWASDKFYHWGGLLAYINFIEKGLVPAPELPIR